MGTFSTNCIIQNHTDRTRTVRISRILVDTGSEYTWIPEDLLERIGVAREKKDIAFVMANDQEITRPVGFAIVRVGDYFTIDEIVLLRRLTCASLELERSRA